MHAVDRSDVAEVNEPLVGDMLQAYGALTREAMQAYLPKAEPRTYLYELLADYPRRGGKMLRSSLCLAMARATGADIEDAIASAVSIELMHNALLVHDDIEDASEERRGTPTLHALHGVPLALNAGDAMGLLSLGPLKDNMHRLGLATALRIFEETVRMAWESAEGQALELGWQRDNRVDLEDEDYLRMALQKTPGSRQFIRCVSVVSSARAAACRSIRLIRLGFFFGAAFQIQDDLLNLDPGSAYGKEANGDLFEGKRTLMIVHALRCGAETERCQLAAFMGRPRALRSAEEVAWVRGLLERTGALAHARYGRAGAGGRCVIRV